VENLSISENKRVIAKNLKTNEKSPAVRRGFPRMAKGTG
jgi:hypothetical protein